MKEKLQLHLAMKNIVGKPLKLICIDVRTGEQYEVVSTGPGTFKRKTNREN